MGKTTKNFNKDLDGAPPNEEVYVDYKDEEGEQPCASKFKTERMDKWIKIHQEKYPGDSSKQQTVEWEEKANDVLQLKVKQKQKLKLTIKFHRTTGVVTCQSEGFMNWAFVTVPAMKVEMDNVSENQHNSDQTNPKTLLFELDGPHSQATNTQNSADHSCCESTNMASKEPSDKSSLDSPFPRRVNERLSSLSKAHSPVNIVNRHFEHSQQKLQQLEGAYVKIMEETHDIIERSQTEITKKIDSEITTVTSVLKKLDSKVEALFKQNNELKQASRLVDETKAEKVSLENKLSQCLEDNERLKAENAELKTTVNELRKRPDVVVEKHTPHIQHEHETASMHEHEADSTREEGQLSDSDNSHNAEHDDSESDDRGFTVSGPSGRRYRDPKQNQTQVLLMRDSIGKFINTKRFFGRKRAQIMNTSTAQQTRQVMRDWEPSGDMDTFIVHQGINDLKNGRSVQQVTDDLQTIMGAAESKYKNARVAFSEILHAGGETNKELNLKISDVNRQMKNFCTNSESDYVYIRHETLQTQDTMYTDDFHINDSSGTAMFVADMQHALRGTVPPRANTTNHDERHPRTYTRSSDAVPKRPRDSQRESYGGETTVYSRTATNTHSPSTSQAGTQRPTSASVHPEPGRVNMEQMMALMTLNLMKNLAQDTKMF